MIDRHKTTRVPAFQCVCGERPDAATSVFEGAEPSAGDRTFCIYCGRAYMFRENRTLREMTNVEVAREIRNNPEFRIAHQLVQRMSRRS